jgi:hypothetical protein
MCFFFNNEMSWLEALHGSQQIVNKISKAKIEMTPKKLCVDLAAPLLPLAEKVFALRFEEEPEYSRLRFMMAKILLKKDVAPNLIFDWSRFKRS